MKMTFNNSDLVVVKSRRLKVEKYLCMVPALMWFGKDGLRPDFALVETDFVVGIFTAYETGGPEFSLDSRHTVAICRRKQDAKLIYDCYTDKV